MSCVLCVTLRVCVQVAIVNYGGSAFSTVPLDSELWAVSIGLGAAGWVVRTLLTAIPTPKHITPSAPSQ